MTFAIDGRPQLSVTCLALSGLLDMFDGKVARTKKDRTPDEKLFGVQIDSLCDVVCFGALPIIICYTVACNDIITRLILAYYGVCSVIRLGFFNVLETNRQREEDGANKYYYGLPITSIAVVLPLVFLVSSLSPAIDFSVLLRPALVIVGTLFILNFKLRKPGNKVLAFLVIVVAAALLWVLFCSRFNVWTPLWWRGHKLP
jgi:CDP-diacylglycerol--serine O-phosphatidyltransferase